LPSVLVLTYGCPKNEADSDRFLRCFRRAGWGTAPGLESADLVLLNTCAFIRPAVEESLEALSSLLVWKDGAPGRRIILAGCLPGRYGDDGTGGLEEIELVAGPGDTAAIERWLGTGSGTSRTPAWKGAPSRYLRIADGCSNRCAYCTIPLIRGGFVPVPRDEILREAALLSSEGAAEIGLVAQDSAMWNGDGTGLTGLLDELSSLYPRTWWRVYYLHPAHFPDGLVDLMESRPNVMPYVDMPVQHVSPAVLARMGRPYGPGEVRSILDRLDSARRRIAARITVISGYPGETDREADDLVAFLSGFGCIRHLVAFPWYPEEGTPECARTLQRGDAVPDHVVSGRISLLTTLSEAILADWGERLTGLTVTVLADTPDEGHTEWDAPGVDCRCLFTGPVTPGGRVTGRIVSSEGSDLLLDTADDGAQASTARERR
jgi:ribosomal protein S12 methylthiotransferase